MLAVTPFSPWSASPARTIWMHLNSSLIHSHNRVLKLRSRNHARRKICICRAADWPQNNETNPILRPATAVVCITAISCWPKHFRTMSATPVYAATSVGKAVACEELKPIAADTTLIVIGSVAAIRCRSELSGPHGPRRARCFMMSHGFRRSRHCSANKV